MNEFSGSFTGHARALTVLSLIDVPRHELQTVEIAGPPRPYASAKAALAPYVKALARNLAPKSIRANMVSPGNVYFKGGVWNVLEENNPELFQTMDHLREIGCQVLTLGQYVRPPPQP